MSHEGIDNSGGQIPAGEPMGRREIPFFVGNERIVLYGGQDTVLLAVREILDISGCQPPDDYLLFGPGEAGNERAFHDLDERIEIRPAERFQVTRRPEYFVDTEGVDHRWPVDEITTEQIAELGGWDPSLGVIEIDRDNVERTLKPGEVVKLKPGHAFAKKVRWKRGRSIWDERVEAEMSLLRARFPGLQYEDKWALVPDYDLEEGWSPRIVRIAFRVADGHPGAAPYGIYVPCGVRFSGELPANYTEPASQQPPFAGSWGLFSWQPDDGQWRPAENITAGANLVNWVLGFHDRFRSGK